MKRIQYHRYGGPDVLRLEEFQPQAPGRGQVLVRVRAAAANALDWKIRSGQLRLMTGRGFPAASATTSPGWSRPSAPT
nr:hypothetical protein GCM10025730_01410 [Promicromonospora thailandica]